MTARTLTRRNLLKAACVSGITAPTIIPSTVLGLDGATAPSERVTLGHIGTGNRGAFLMQSIAGATEVQSVAIADCFQDRRESFAANVGAEAYQDFRQLLDRGDIDGVIVATPDHWHVPIAVMAARAGKDVYVEKPLGLSLEQDLICQRVFREQNRILQYGTQQREAKHMQFGRDLIRAGKLGQLKAIEVQAPDGGTGGSTAIAPVPAGFDYDMWLGPAPPAPYTVDRCKPSGTYWIYDQSIGYLAGWGAHPLDVLVWCYDGDQAGPYSVEGTGLIPTEGLYDTVYHWDLTFTMSDGVTITFKPGSDSTKFIGDQAKVELTRNSIRTFPQELVDVELPGNDHRRNSGRHILVFAESIRSRQPPSSPIEDAVRSDVMSHLGDIAVRTGERITWDPAKSELIDASDTARAMVSRLMRKPWAIDGV